MIVHGRYLICVDKSIRTFNNSCNRDRIDKLVLLLIYLLSLLLILYILF